VFSYGLVLGEIWGQHPFGHYSQFKSTNEVIVALERKTILPTYAEECPSDMKAVISQCIAWNPDERPNFQQILDKMSEITSATLK
jgi:hypothetical protein